MIVVIDTNCLLVSIPPKSPYYWLYAAFEKEQFIWAISNEVLHEYEEQITDKYSAKTADLVLSILLSAPNTVLKEPYYNWHLIHNDKDDNKFVDLALTAGADCLVSNDKDFNVLKTIDFPKIQLLTLNDFKTYL
ncbi:MAG: putative toxin-antitoxin system toxin component, PIN family [Bernardetiaceae bacterium]|nr:putative toxin-antitoxin system toxin component, PIN family [Bernardetiaceae bacterium]